VTQPRSRPDIESLEAARLAPYAFLSTNSRGREFRQQDDPHRTLFQRDRDRIVHSRSFRRLAYKTQVFTNDFGDLFRSRLTHTLEVAQLARSGANRLGLNEDLVECSALVHDLGHPPFGHQGEHALADLMADFGGFEHNRQALRIVEELEWRYVSHPGLNLSYEVREGIVKHQARAGTAVPVRFRPDEGPLLEAQLADAVDALAYDCHDIDDAIRAGLISLEEAAEAVPLVAAAVKRARSELPVSVTSKLLLDAVLRLLMQEMLNDLLEHSWPQVSTLASVAEVRASETLVIQASPSMQRARKALEEFLFTRVYRHYQVNRTFQTAKRLIAALFEYFITAPETLPDDHQDRVEERGLERVVADYIAGMTDRYARDLHAELIGAGA
jgi:dGTPase